VDTSAPMAFYSHLRGHMIECVDSPTILMPEHPRDRHAGCLSEYVAVYGRRLRLPTPATR
jgi:hypothetical protein